MLCSSLLACIDFRLCERLGTLFDRLWNRKKRLEDARPTKIREWKLVPEVTHDLDVGSPGRLAVRDDRLGN